MQLRDVEPGDHDVYVAMRCDPAMMGELGGPLPAGGIAAKVAADVASVAADDSWICMVVVDDQVAGQVVLWPSSDAGVTVSETGWMVLPAFQGRGVATAAMRRLLARADADGRWGAIHAYPGVGNAPSNGVCAALGFRAVATDIREFQGRPLPVRHWVRDCAGDAVRSSRPGSVARDMRSFSCAVCGNLLAFENFVCLRCGTEVGYDATARDVVPWSTGLFRCANAALADCNWLVPQQGPPLCPSCALTRTRPDDTDAEALVEFARAEAAKRRLVFQLDELALAHPPGRLSFDLLSSRDAPVTTGHADGVITLDLAEGDDAHREALRTEMDEPYRTLLGHFRHETGHYYWEVLVRRTPALRSFRALFGDEREDYGEALQKHYAQGPPADWQQTYVSGYAAAHPWEDWAESFAHYLHIRDTLQTGASFGVVVAGPDLPREILAAIPTGATSDFDEMVETWHAFTLALNAVNRSMGHDDLYPFVLAPTVLGKLRFVDRLVRRLTPG